MAKVKMKQQPKKKEEMVAGEMTGKLYKKSEMDAWEKQVTKSMNDQYFNRPENLKYGKGDKKPAEKKVTIVSKNVKEITPEQLKKMRMLKAMKEATAKQISKKK